MKTKPKTTKPKTKRKTQRIQTVQRRHQAAAVFAVSLLLALANLCQAAPIPLRVKPGKMSSLTTAKPLSGGRASTEFSILGVRQARVRDGVERVIIAYGDRNGKPVKGSPGYFHAALDRNGRRLVLDLAQVSQTAVDHKDLSRILAGSALIAASDMTMDPQDGSTNLTLSLRDPTRVSVTTEAGSHGEIVIELRRAKPRRAP